MNKKIIKDTYNKTAQDYHKKWSDYSPLFKRTSKEFLKHIPKGGKILDLGCGPGRDAKYFSQKGYQVLGIDFSSKMLKIARKVAPKAKFLKQDIYNFDISDKFDGVWLSFVLLHIKRSKTVQVLASVKSLLKSGGVLFISTKEGKGESLEKDNIDKSLKMYEVYYTKEEIKRLLKEAGFDPIALFLDTDRKESDERIVIVLAKNGEIKKGDKP